MAKTIEVLLTKDYYYLGKAGQVVKVKPGFARNFLIPQKIALPVTEGLLKTIEEQQKIIQRKTEKQKESSSKIKEKLDNQRISVKLPTGKDGKLYQALTKEKIALILQEKTGSKIDKHSIELEKPIKSTGIFQINLNLPGGIKTSLELEIES
ncbi:MAG: 50S ribosomal protein L9 [Candidatus Calescibacterium sp.]|nr:50S ribosomal protein L9 [Candidatus Calescibacterium sp.]